MIVAKSREELDKARDEIEGKLAFVPTMGALHEGHLSLCRLAREKADHVAVSIFVNPAQFAPNEDLDNYPRTLDADLKKLEALDVDLVYVPQISDMYKDGAHADLKAGQAALGLESDFRPHFFDGVVSIVYRLFDQMRPDIAIFGEKDFQQQMVIREMVKEHSLPVTIIAGETARDEMGLALSSRNAYLNESEIEIARMLNQILYGVAHGIAEGIDVQDACNNAAELLETAGFDNVDYVAYRKDWNRVLIAAWLGKTRLIDNCSVIAELPANRSLAAI